MAFVLYINLETLESGFLWWREQRAGSKATSQSFTSELLSSVRPECRVISLSAVNLDAKCLMLVETLRTLNRCFSINRIFFHFLGLLLFAYKLLSIMYLASLLEKACEKPHLEF